MTDIAIADADQARQLTDRIKVAVEGTWLLIQEAYTSRAWAALGYATWDAYVDAEFRTARLALPKEERAETIQSLRAAGMSIRAISSATGAGVGTVHRELSGSTVPNGTPDQRGVVGTDGRVYAQSPSPAHPKVRQVAALLLHRAGYDREWIAERLNSAEMPSDISAITSEQLDAAATHLQAIGITYYGVGQAAAKLRDELPTRPAPTPEPGPEPDLLAGDDWIQPAAPDFAPTVTQPEPPAIPVSDTFDGWTDDERTLHKSLTAGETVVVSLRHHQRLIGWAERRGLYERIDRRTPWGNPFELPADGDRDTVIANYEHHYLPYKPSLLDRLHELKGKALGCWCAPEPCHGDILKNGADEL